MKRINPKSHDSLVKWLITSFTEEFFAHYFPGIRIGRYSFIDKEFIRKYEALKESLKGDLFLLMEVEIDGGFQEIAIQIEHQSEREDVSERDFRKSLFRSNIRVSGRMFRSGFLNICAMSGC